MEEVTYISNQSLWDNPDSYIKTDDCSFFDHYALNVLVVPQGLAPHAGRAISFPGDRAYAFFNLHGSVVMHELGHLLGLDELYVDFGCFIYGSNGEIIGTTGTGDGIDDTPPYRAGTTDGNGIFLGYNGCEIDWTLYMDQCGNSFPEDHDPNNIYLNNIMGGGELPAGCTEIDDNVFTPGQGDKMKETISGHHFRYAAGNQLTLSGSIDMDTDIQNRIVQINGDLEINAELTISNSTLLISAGSRLNVNSALSMVDVKMWSQCGGDVWEGIRVPAGSILNLIESEINDAHVALDISSTNVTTNDSDIRTNCDVGIVVTGSGVQDGTGQNGVEITNMEIGSPSFTDNATVFFKGCGFLADLECTQSDIFLYPSHVSPFRKTTFFNTQVNYISGSRFQIDDCHLENSTEPVVNINQCDYFTCCQSFISNEGAEACIVANNVTKYDVFLNLVSHFGQGAAFELESGTYEGSFIRDNIFSNGDIHIRTQVPTSSLDIYCNEHSNYLGTAWDIGGFLKDQGSPTKSNENQFNAGLDIVSAHNFNYYADISNPSRPDDTDGIDVIPITSSGASECTDMMGLIQSWRDYIYCEEVTRLNDPQIICCSCCAPPPPPTPQRIEDLEGRERSAATRLQPSVYPNPTTSRLNVEGTDGYQELFISDIHGKTLFQIGIDGGSQSIDLSTISRGLYILKLTSTELPSYEEIFVKL